jgi:hypothetical protein
MAVDINEFLTLRLGDSMSQLLTEVKGGKDALIAVLLNTSMYMMKLRRNVKQFDNSFVLNCV